MYAAVVEPSKIARVPGLHRKITSIGQLDQQVEAGLPKASLGAVARHVYGTSPGAAALMQRVIPSAPGARRTDVAGFKPLVRQAATQVTAADNRAPADAP